MCPPPRLLAPYPLLRALVCLLLVAAAYGPAKRVAAQPLGELVVIPFGAPDASLAISASGMLEAELANEGHSVISLHEARDRFALRSRPPQTPSESDLDVLAREAREAIEHVAFGRTAAAQKSVRTVITRAERALESLNRETTTARRILDACLSLVRSALQSGRRDLALDQATSCRRLVPDLAPAEDAHPANVVGVLAEADNLLRRMRIGDLRVRSRPLSGCAVYLNGRQLGATPFRIDRAAAGEYRVQVECGRNLGRVHVVELGERPVELNVDTELDRAVASEPRLILRYEDAHAARGHAVAHAAEIGREIGVEDVLLVFVRGDQAELTRVHTLDGRLVARARVPFAELRGFAQPTLSEAIERLAQARDQGELAPTDHPLPEQPATPQAPPDAPDAPRDAAAPAPEATAPAKEAALPAHVAASVVSPPHADRAPRSSLSRRRRAGYALLAPALALFAVGIAADLRAHRLEQRALDLAFRAESGMGGPSPDRAAQLDQLDDLQHDFERMRRVRWAGAAGPLLASASAALLVKPRRVPPWWSYALGAAGLGLLAAGSYDAALHRRCELRTAAGSCRRRRESLARGVLIASAAAPLLTVPIAHWTQARLQPAELVATSRISRGAPQLVLRLTY